jgi:predicted O-methyltransferase YrrM
LADRVRADGLFQDAGKTAGIASLIPEPKRMNLFLLMTHYLPKLEHRNVVEFGTYRGGNALFMANVMRVIDPDAKVYALDTFEGMPETDKIRDAHSAGDFADANLDGLRKAKRDLKLDNLIIVKGFFSDTFPDLQGPFGLAHIDCDIYSAVKYAQEAVWPKMSPGGYVVYDDAEISSCIGATEAVEELIQTGKHSEQVWPHFVFRAGL